MPKMPVKDLKIELKKRGIKNTGKKAELVSLLTDALAKGVGTESGGGLFGGGDSKLC